MSHRPWPLSVVGTYHVWGTWFHARHLLNELLVLLRDFTRNYGNLNNNKLNIFEASKFQNYFFIFIIVVTWASFNLWRFADRYEKYPLHLWWSICWFREDHFREVITFLVLYVYENSFTLLASCMMGTFFFQTARFFHWLWSTSSCEHEKWWIDQCCSDILIAGICENPRNMVTELNDMLIDCILLVYFA